jgi:hypothetical protein
LPVGDLPVVSVRKKARTAKENSLGRAGVFTAHAAIELYAENSRRPAPSTASALPA